MMKRSNFTLLLLSLAALAITLSCDKNPLVNYGEQYKKTLYIVHAEGMEYVKEHQYENTNDTIYISVYCASSEPITEPVQATLKLDPRVLDSLNYLNGLENANYVPKQPLPTEFYTFPEAVVRINAGEQFGLLKIPVQLTGIDPDIAYAIPVTLVSNTAGYDMNPKLLSIVYQPAMINNYSGLYTGISQEEAETTPRSITPTLTALSKDRLRLPIHNLADNSAMLSTNYMVLTIAGDGTTVSITPYEDAPVVGGTGVYDDSSKTFELDYTYLDDGEPKTIHAMITNVEFSDGE